MDVSRWGMWAGSWIASKCECILKIHKKNCVKYKILAKLFNYNTENN